MANTKTQVAIAVSLSISFLAGMVLFVLGRAIWGGYFWLVAVILLVPHVTEAPNGAANAEPKAGSPVAPVGEESDKTGDPPISP